MADGTEIQGHFHVVRDGELGGETTSGLLFEWVALAVEERQGMDIVSGLMGDMEAGGRVESAGKEYHRLGFHAVQISDIPLNRDHYRDVP
jgi:hypothetical protein